MCFTRHTTTAMLPDTFRQQLSGASEGEWKMHLNARLVFALCAAVFLHAVSSDAASISVDAKSNIWGAGHASPPDETGGPNNPSDSGGILPPSFSFAAGPNQAIAFSSV